MKKKNTTLLIITLVSIAALLGYSSYAIIAMGTTLEDYNIFAQTSNGLAFTVETENNFTNNVSVNNMDNPENNTEVVNTSDNVNITLDTDGQKAICCTYDITWEWENTTNEKDQYHKSQGATNEYVLKSSYQTSYENNGGGSVTNGSEQNNTFTQQLPDYDDKNGQSEANTNKTLKSGEKLCNKNGDVLSKKVTRTYTFNTVFYNLKDVNQDALRRGVFKGHIVITNIKCNKDNSNS